MNKPFHDLKFERLPCGTIRMEQHDSAGELHAIYVHPAQFTHLARVLVAEYHCVDTVEFYTRPGAGAAAHSLRAP